MSALGIDKVPRKRRGSISGKFVLTFKVLKSLCSPFYRGRQSIVALWSVLKDIEGQKSIIGEKKPSNINTSTTGQLFDILSHQAILNDLMGLLKHS